MTALGAVLVLVGGLLCIASGLPRGAGRAANLYQVGVGLVFVGFGLSALGIDL